MTQPQENRMEILARHLKTSSAMLDTTNLEPEIKERIRLINALSVQIFLDPKDIETHYLLPYICYLINRFNLAGYLCEVDIFIEAYTIAIEKTRAGYVIHNLPSWFKGTALNIIRNLKGEFKKQESVKSKLEYSHQETTELSWSDEFNDAIKPMLQALLSLSEDDRYLLKLRTVKGLTWSDIAETMIREGKEKIPTSMSQLLAKLRQRHKRALNRLRAKHEECAQKESKPFDETDQ